MAMCKDVWFMDSGINVVGKVERKGVPKLVDTKYGASKKVCGAFLKDETGEVRLTLWDSDVEFVTVVVDWLQQEEKKDVKNPWYSTMNGVRSDESVVTPWRVATMGRLSEMGIVNWEIERKTGSSEFSLSRPTEEAPKIIKH